MEKTAPKAPTIMERPPLPFSQRLKKKNKKRKFLKFISILKQLSINLHLIDTLKKMPKYTMFMKDLDTKKRIVSQELINGIRHCNTIATRSLVQKKDPKVFTIPCTIRVFNFAMVLCNLEATTIRSPHSDYNALNDDRQNN